MILFVFLLCSLTLVNSLVVNDKTVVSYGGPKTFPVLDKYNQASDWNRTYHPEEPQQIHVSWTSDGLTFTVQFSTMQSVKKSLLWYWSKDEKNEEQELIQNSLDWEFVDGGIAQHKQFMHSLSSYELNPSTVYRYKVATISQKDTTLYSSVFEIHTPALEEQSKSFKFIATGDMGVVNAVSLPVFNDLANSHEYDFVAIMGDQGYDMADFNGTKGDEYMNFVQSFYANVPILTTAGNHESHYNFSHYKNRFDLMPYRQSDFPNAMLYSINYKSLHLISFSTEAFFEGSDDEIITALNWLEQDLIKATRTRSTRPWIIVMGHRPIYCSILSNEDCTSNAERLRFGTTGGLETLLTKYNVDLYLCGHKHNYERTFPVRNNTVLTESYHNAPSFFQVITGNAGNYEGPDLFDETNPLPAWLAHRYQGYGFSSIEITPQHLNLHHYKSNMDGTLGKLQDHVRVSKTTSHVNKQKIISAATNTHQEVFSVSQ